jgi:hypothetical protein
MNYGPPYEVLTKYGRGDKIVIPTTDVLGPFHPMGSNWHANMHANYRTEIPTNKN